MMKRYLLFCGYDYYPSGGWSDFVGSYDSILEAHRGMIFKDWYHIVDSTTLEIVKEDSLR